MSQFSVTNNIYLRNCYSTYRELSVRTHRSDATSDKLSFADSYALQRAIRKLKSFDYDSDTDSEYKNQLKSFIDAYNYTIESGSSSTDNTVNSATKQIKQLTTKYKDELKKMGITSDAHGYLSLSSYADANLKSANYKEMFGEDSDFTSKLKSYAKRITKHIDIYL